MTKPEPPSGFRWNRVTVVWSFATVIGLLAAAIWWTSAKEVESGASYTALLLLVSPILLAVGFPFRAQLPTWFAWLYAALEVWKSYLLYAYSHAVAAREQAEVLSLAAVFVACAMLAFVLVIARFAIERSEHHPIIREYFFATICGALYMFSHVSYDLTFALALHDRGMASALQIPQRVALQVTTPLTRSDEYTLHFSEGGFSIGNIVTLAALIEDWPPASTDQRAAVERKTFEKNEAKNSEIAFDVDQWKRLLARIEHDRPSWWRVTIIGHASDAIASVDGKEKNQSLSEARSEETRTAIQTELKKRQPNIRIDWRLFAVSNDDRFRNSTFLDGKDHKLCVEIVLERERELELLDYAYFMIYTITTTGYGDLIPASPRAKFITCLANMFELLFIVILVNLAFGVYRSEGQEKKAADAVGVNLGVAANRSKPVS